MQLTQLGRLRQLSCRRLSICCPSCCLALQAHACLEFADVQARVCICQCRPCEQRELGAVQCHIIKRPQQPLKASTTDPASDAKLACKIMRSAHKAPQQNCQQQCVQRLRYRMPYPDQVAMARQGRTFQGTLATSTKASWCCRVRPLSRERLYDNAQKCFVTSRRSTFGITVGSIDCEVCRHLPPRLPGTDLPCSEVN